METIALKLPKDQLFRTYYLEVFPRVCRFVKNDGGSLEDARDIFQDALIVFHEKISSEEQREIISNEQAYLGGIARNLWLKKLSAMRRGDELLRELAGTSENEKENVSPALLAYVRAAGEKCLKLLTAFYYEQLRMPELAEKFGFSGERSATVQKHKCLRKVRSILQDRQLRKEDFYE